MATKKLTWLLLLQGWTMLWVVIGHAPLSMEVLHGENGLDNAISWLADFFFTFAYSFHMPLFIMISGYLFYRTRVVRGWKYLDMVKDKWLRLGIPYILFITLAIVVKLCMPGSVGRTVDFSPWNIVMNYVSPYNGALQEMWFVAVIFLYFMAYPVYPYLLKDRFTISLAMIAAIGMYFIPTSLITNIFAINLAVHYFVYFYVGMAISRLKLEEATTSWPCVAGSIAIYLLSQYFGLPLIGPMSASIAFWGMAMIIDRKLTSNIFHTFRNYTYQIFLIGIFVQIAVKVMYSKFHTAGDYLVYYILCILIGVYVPVLIAKIGERTDNKFVKRMLGI